MMAIFWEAQNVDWGLQTWTDSKSHIFCLQQNLRSGAEIWFDAFLDKLHAASPLHLHVVDDHKHMDLMDDADVENVEDTLTILNKYVESMDIQGKKKPLTELMTSLYNEA